MRNQKTKAQINKKLEDETHPLSPKLDKNYDYYNSFEKWSKQRLQ